MSNFISLLLKGIGTALALFTVFGMFFDWVYEGNLAFGDWTYTKMVIGTVAVGAGFSIPALIYESEKLSYGIKVLIHMGIGCVILLVTGFIVGWIPREMGILACILAACVQIAVAFVWWAGYTWQFRRMAKKMNDKIKEINGDN